jgi:hypothetical protein
LEKIWDYFFVDVIGAMKTGRRALPGLTSISEEERVREREREREKEANLVRVAIVAKRQREGEFF